MDYNRIRAANDRLMGHKRVTPSSVLAFLDDCGKAGFCKTRMPATHGQF